MDRNALPMPPASRPPRAWMRALRQLTTGRVGITLAFAVAVALLLNPIFVVPFSALLGRLVFIAMMLLLAFTLAGQWRHRWLPRWVVQALAVALAAPVATFVVYMLSVGGDVRSFLHNEARVAGFLWITGSGLIVGVTLAMAALYRERDAQARAEALAFQLERSTLERQALDARLATLRAQIEPHFLFNTLANVQALVESGSPRAAPVLQSLIAYLRAAMPQMKSDDETLGAEGARVQAYLELMHLRMPDRLEYEVRVDAALASECFPSMGLLTLVENAVRHGIDPGEQGGRIEVVASRDGHGLHVSVADSGGGMDAAAAEGTGLANLRARLDAFYAGRARLELSENAPHGLRAEIVIAGDEGRVAAA
jgi:signal transduction histidine kinase